MAFWRIIGSIVCALIGPVEVEMPSEHKLLVAHRGASAYAPEHTLQAYLLAIKQGADFVEQDLQVSRDGVLVCLHDRTLERTTNVEKIFPGRFREIQEEGTAVKKWFVVDFALEELKKLDAGSWFDPKFENARIATFQEAIDLIKGQAGLYPELKDPGFYRQEGFHMEELLIDILKRNGLYQKNSHLETPIIIQSFSESSLRRLKFELDCHLPMTYLFSNLSREDGMSTERIKEIRKFATGIGPNKQVLLEDPELVQRVHSAGLTITPYTFRSLSVPPGFTDVESEMSYYLFNLGIDALFTDNPDLFPRRTNP